MTKAVKADVITGEQAAHIRGGEKDPKLARHEAADPVQNAKARVYPQQGLSPEPQAVTAPVEQKPAEPTVLKTLTDLASFYGKRVAVTLIVNPAYEVKGYLCGATPSGIFFQDTQGIHFYPYSAVQEVKV